jgi:hypothetical protein
VNFARSRPFVLGLATVRIAGDHLLRTSFCTRTVGGKQGDVGSSYDIKGDVISAEQNSVAVSHTNGGALCSLPGRVGQAIFCGR